MSVDKGFAGMMPPAADEVHLWKVNLELPEEQLARLRLLLSPDELQRAGDFLQAADRARYTVTRSALRILLGRYGSVPAGKIEFSYSSHGKPSCPSLLPIQFNVAHSGTLALIAIAREQAVGVDIERIRTGFDLDGIGRQVFTASELIALDQQAPGQRVDAFFNLWTRKEAYLKCSGEGFMGSPGKIHVGLPPSEPSAGPDSGQPESSSSRLVKSFHPEAGYAAALAVEKVPVQIVLRDWKWMT